MEQLQELKARYAQSPDEFSRRSGDDQKLAQFQQRFPLASLPKLSLEDYCLGYGSRPDNFSWWLERGLQPVLGRYAPGTSRGHLVYRKKDGSFYKHGELSDLSDADAVAYVMALTSTIARVPSLEKAQALDAPGAIFKAADVTPRMTMGEARWIRIFSAYHPDDVVPINSQDHLDHFLQILGIPPSQIAEGPFGKAAQLWQLYVEARVEMPGLTPFGFARLLYDKQLGLAPVQMNSAAGEAPDGDRSEVESLPRNMILYGPPGTGKTYRSIDHAVKILDPQAYRAAGKDRAKLLASFNQAKRAGRVEFVTFHQSFSYEDFVEGLKAEPDENGQLVFRPADGVFKRMCDVASSRQVQRTDKTLDPNGRTVWKMSLGNAQLDDRFDECIQHGVAALGFGEDIDFTGCKNREDIKSRFKKAGTDTGRFDYAVTALELFVTAMKPGDLVVVSEGNHKFRAIGEIKGGYRYSSGDEIGNFHHQREVDWVRVYSPSLPVDALLHKVFSQMTIYKLSEKTLNLPKLEALLSQVAPTPRVFAKGDKVGSYVVESVGPENLTLRKPKTGGSLPIAWSVLDALAEYVKAGQITVADIRDGLVFSKVASPLEKSIVNGHAHVLAPAVEKLVSGVVTEKTQQEQQSRVLIIDEINRGNVSKVFGELITLIEDNKRAGQAEALSVTLPYSKDQFSVPSNLFLIGTMNTADRSLTGVDIALRRRFQMVHVPPDPSLLKGIVVEGVDLSRLLLVMNRRLELLLGPDLLIGHSYFLGLRDEGTVDSLKQVFLRNIIPLLQEYFFEDGSKIARVLGDHTKPPQFQIMTKSISDAEVGALLGDDWSAGGSAGWSINTSALEEPAAYRGIYEPTNG